ncbi:hypothetical protein Enr13x_20150 [Stieleria neptunia]|uniref:Uncharacterized protein n=1 Tax=Stieleria neptunia TaxID=2527979 RepID=A0A518HMU1_9BACT|nr:hypothetical protein [Stieleria neptunia]QDV42172.1 hypothetical protein Enr13x_20150 [Stieleria neptunia]
MTNPLQVPLRLLIWLLLGCALGAVRPADAQYPSPEAGRSSTALSSTDPDAPFSWSIDEPEPIEGLLLPELLSVPVTVGTMPATLNATPQSHGHAPHSLAPSPAATVPSPHVRMASSDPLSDLPAVEGQPAVVLAQSDTALPPPDRGAIAQDVPQRNPLPSPDAARPRILFQPAVPSWDPAAGTILRPTVHLADDPAAEILPTPNAIATELVPSTLSGQGDRIAIAEDLQPDPVWVPSAAGDRFETFRNRRRKPLAKMFERAARAMRSQAGRDVGVGVERLPFALFEIDASQPSNNFRLRFESARDWEFADRVEYFWSRIGKKGPEFANPLAFEPSVDYQDIRLSFEVGGSKFSATTELPLRFIDPTNLSNTGGMGDMAITTKTVMIDGDSLQLTQVLRNQLSTGSAKRGLGNGHVSMEPGFVASYKWSDRTLIHNELKLWFPIGGEPGFSGPVLRYGMGFANVLYDSDTFAILPTFELVGWSILTGQKSVGLPNPQSIDGENIINLYPGLRIVRDNGRLFELGINGGFSVTERHWYRSVLRLDLRWTF